MINISTEYDFGEDNDSEEESRFRRGRSYYIDDYINKMALMLGIAATPHDEGTYYRFEDLIDKFVKFYNTKVVLCGDYIRIITYTHPYEAMKYDAKTGELKEFYQDNSANKIDKTVNLAYANADIFKTYITLSFKKDVVYDDAITALNAWVGAVKYAHKGFKYMRVIGKGGKRKRMHFHLLTSLDVEADASMFVKADVEEENVYNLTNWKKYGFSKVNKINTPKDLTYIATYIGKHNYRKKDFPGKRIMSKSNGLIKPKVLYCDSCVDQPEIDVLIKDAFEITNYKYKDHFGSDTKGKIYKIGAEATDVFEYPSRSKKSKKKPGVYDVSHFATADLDQTEKYVFDEDDAPAASEVAEQKEKVAVYISEREKRLDIVAVKLAQSMKHCELKGYDAKYFIDFGYRSTFTNRPKYKKMMARMKKNKVNKIVTVNTAAISINPIDLDAFKKDVIEHNCKFETVLDNDNAQLMMQQEYTIW